MESSLNKLSMANCWLCSSPIVHPKCLILTLSLLPIFQSISWIMPFPPCPPTAHRSAFWPDLKQHQGGAVRFASLQCVLNGRDQNILSSEKVLWSCWACALNPTPAPMTCELGQGTVSQASVSSPINASDFLQVSSGPLLPWPLSEQRRER